MDGRKVSKSRIRGLSLLQFYSKRERYFVAYTFYGHGMMMMTWTVEVKNIKYVGGPKEQDYGDLHD